MPKRAARPQKPPNGQANSGTYLLTFDLDDPAQVMAWEKAQDLAGQRKLKHVLTGMLLAIDTVERHTGKPIDMTVFMAQFVSIWYWVGRRCPPIRLTQTPKNCPVCSLELKIAPIRWKRGRHSLVVWAISFQTTMRTSGTKVA